MKSLIPAVVVMVLIVSVLVSEVNGQFGRQRQRQTTSRRGGDGNRGGKDVSTGGTRGGNGGSNTGNGRGPYERLPQFDQVLAEAGNFQYSGKNELSGRSLDEDIFTSDGKNVLIELDELEPVPCKLERTSESASVRVIVAQSDAAVGSGSCSQRRRGGGGRRRNNGKGIDLTGRGNNFRGRSRGKRAATNDLSLRWPNTTIAYRLSAPPREPFDSEEMESINAAVAEYDRYTCIKLVPRIDELNFINIIRDGACYSSVGWYYWNQPNTLSLARGCAKNKATPIHEFMHALGVYHQQSRPDRNQYVRINSENIEENRLNNFLKLETEKAELAGTEYSYRSVMHYGKNAFSIDRANKVTITTLDPAYQDIIGRATTFSFEDLQLINRIYDCDGHCTTSCPPKSYRGKDCKCYCPNKSNFDIPAIPCEDVSECSSVGETCNCARRPNACSDLQNTQCNTNTGTCECDSNSGLIDGTCYRFDDVICNEVGQDCLCSMKSSGACDPLQNTVCNSQTNACECRSGYQLNADGVCVDVNGIVCDGIGKSCFCSQKTNACSRLANSYCDLLTDRCECDEDFFASSGSCSRAPACTTAGQSCKCSVQGQDACAAISGSACDENSDACECLLSHKQTSQGTCQPSVTNYISDGMSISPFITSNISTANSQFRPDQGEDPAKSKKTFGVRPNFWRLRASGTGADQRGAIQTGMLQPGTWCLNFSYKMKNAAIYYQVSNDGISWSNSGLGADWVMRKYFKKTEKYFSDIPFMIRLLAEVYPYQNQPWEVLLDPIVVRQC